MAKAKIIFSVWCLLQTSYAWCQKFTEEKKENIVYIDNKGGQPLGYSVTSRIKIITTDGFAFKDLNKNGKLDKYEDRRLPFEVRAKDLASKMTVEQIAGLMLYSRHQSVPARPGGYFAGSYNGKPYKEGETLPAALTDQQKDFLNIKATVQTVGNPQLMKEGYEAQLQSMVLLKNQQLILPLTKGKTLYVPKKFTPYSVNFLGIVTPEKTEYPVNIEIVKKYFAVTDIPDEADYALVFINNPISGGGYDTSDVKNGGNGYVPVRLQYGPYTASNAREVSIAGGDPLENFTNRSYKGKTVKAINITDLGMVTETYAKMKGKPVVVSITMDNPMVFTEFEKLANAILVNFSVQDQAILDILTGTAEPSGLLPLQMPASMEEVEKQKEDVPCDMKCHTDTEGNLYDVGFGVNWKGVIKDERIKKFKK